MTTATAHRLTVTPGPPAGCIDAAIRTEQPTRRFGERGAVVGLSTPNARRRSNGCVEQQVGIAAPSSEIPGCCHLPEAPA
jgi:hypothetical protein